MKTLLRLFVAATLVVTTVGCGDDGGDDDAVVRIIHASPNAPAVDVRLDDDDTLSAEDEILADVPYLGNSGYLEVDAGMNRIQVLVANTSTVVIDASLDLEDDSATTVIATGLVTNLAPLVLEDDRSAPEAGNAKLRVVHGAPSAPTVDVYVTAPGAALGGTPTLANVPFRGASDYLEVPAGSYRVRVTIAGTQTVAIDTGAVALAAGDVFTAIAVDNAGGGAPFSVLLADDAE